MVILIVVLREKPDLQDKSGERKLSHKTRMLLSLDPPPMVLQKIKYNTYLYSTRNVLNL